MNSYHQMSSNINNFGGTGTGDPNTDTDTINNNTDNVSIINEDSKKPSDTADINANMMALSDNTAIILDDLFESFSRDMLISKPSNEKDHISTSIELFTALPVPIHHQSNSYMLPNHSDHILNHQIVNRYSPNLRGPSSPSTKESNYLGKGFNFHESSTFETINVPISSPFSISYDPQSLQFFPLLQKFISGMSLKQLSRWLPPYNRHSLDELDMNRILDNEQIRHDLYLRPDLIFTPAELKGEHKWIQEEETNRYWCNIQSEVSWLISWESYINKSNESFKPPSLLYAPRYSAPIIHLPFLLNEIRELVLGLLPDNSNPLSSTFREELIDRFDISHFLGQCQIGKFPRFECIAQIFIHFMEQFFPSKLSMISWDTKLNDNNINMMIRIFQDMLNVLESIKLDLVNRQLAKKKPMIIKEASIFEWNKFCEGLHTKIESIACLDIWLGKHLKYALNPLEGIDDSVSPKNRSWLFNDAIFRGVVELISTDEYWINRDINNGNSLLPETFRLDISSLRRCYGYWKEAFIVQTAIFVMKQIVPDANEQHSIIMRDELIVLLRDGTCTTEHLRAHLCKYIDISMVHTKEFKKQGMNLANRLWDQFLIPGHRVNSILTDRLCKILLYYLRTGEFHLILMKSSCWDYTRPILESLVQLLKPIVEFNLRTYRILYNQILSRHLGSQ